MEKAEVVREGWNGFNVLHDTASRVAALDVGFLPSARARASKGGCLQAAGWLSEMGGAGKVAEKLPMLGRAWPGKATSAAGGRRRSVRAPLPRRRCMDSCARRCSPFSALLALSSQPGSLLLPPPCSRPQAGLPAGC